MSLLEEWKSLAGAIRDAGLNIFGTADIPRTETGFADEKVLAVTLLARTVSNVKATILLVEAKRIIEARTITRCVLENLYWVVGLAEEGEAFVRKMRDDDLSHSRNRGQDIFSGGVDLESGVSERLRAYLKGLSAKIDKARTLAPKQVASIRSDFEKTHIFYGQLSSDAAHPSVTALNRYVVPDSHPDGGGIDVEPVVSEHELVQTLEFLCMAAMGVCVATNQIIGGTPAGAALNSIADRYTDLSNRTKALG